MDTVNVAGPTEEMLIPGRDLILHSKGTFSLLPLKRVQGVRPYFG